MLNATLLSELMELSPSIDHRINELLVSVMQDDYDTVSTPMILTNQSIDILINELEDQGIRFHVDRDEICSDYYSLKYITLLYRNFTPRYFKTYLENNIRICRCIGANSPDTSTDEFIVKLLEIVKDIEPTQENIDLYVYASDKICSTESYVNEIDRILHDVYTRYIDTNEQFTTITSEDIMFLKKLSQEKVKYTACMNYLMYTSSVKLDTKRTMWLASQFRTAYALPENVKILSQYDVLVASNPIVISKLIQLIRRNSDFYVDGKSDIVLDYLHLEELLGMVMAQLSDQYLFNIPPNYDKIIPRLQRHGDLTIDVLERQYRAS